MGPRQRQGRSRSKTHALPIILLSFLGFLLIAGVAFGIGMVGNVNRWLSDLLPDYTDANAYLVSEPTEIVDCNGNKIASFYTQNRKSITKDKVSPYVLQGTVDVEDERFYEHGGIDLWGIARAAVATLGGGHEGASTITQQLVRNTILQEEQFDSTIERKVREAYIAVKMEDMYSKDEILMMYLNTIYYGHGAYGIEAAAETYLSKSAADLTLSEAALLIGLPNSPSQYDPTVNPDLALSRRNKVLDNMLRLGHITQEEHDAAQAEPITLNVTEISGSGVDVYSQPYFVAYVKQLLEQEFSTDVLFKGSLTVKTTIDPTMQQVAENAVREQLDTLSLDALDMGMVVVDPKTGYIKCMVGGYDYNADENHVNHATAKRPVGSTFKAFTLATAIQNGMNPNVTLNCNSPLKAKGTTTEVQNYANHSYGNITLKQATAYSSNTGYIQVAEAVGNSKIISLVKKLGIDPANIRMFDSKGILHKGRTDLNKYKAQFALSEDMTMTEALKGADLFLGLSKKDLLTPDMIKGMADHPVIFACANPDPEIAYPLAMETRPDCIMGTGRTDFPNQINNLSGFPYIFRGALDVYATEINEAMKLAAARALAALAKEPVPAEVSAAYQGQTFSFGQGYVIPKPFDPRLIEWLPPAVAQAAMDTGVARKPIEDMDAYKASLRVRIQKAQGRANALIESYK